MQRVFNSELALLPVVWARGNRWLEDIPTLISLEGWLLTTRLQCTIHNYSIRMNQLLQLKVLLLSVEEIMKIVIFLEPRNA